MVVIFLFKEPHFYADGLQVTTRCAIRGKFSRKRSGMGQDVQIVNDGAPTQIEEILADTTITSSASSLPSTNICSLMFNCYPPASFVVTFWRLLALA